MKIKNEYLARKVLGNKNKENFRDWWLGKPTISFYRNVSIPKEFWGKRIRFKIEVVPEDFVVQEPAKKEGLLRVLNNKELRSVKEWSNG